MIIFAIDMKKQKTYYHIIEDNFYLVAWQGCYDNLQEAEKELKRLQEIFTQSYLYIFTSTDQNEPPITTA